MANIRKAWVFSPHKPVAPKVPAQVKADLQQKADELVETVLKPKYIQSPPAPDQFQHNYIADIYTKWYRHYFYFCAKYCVPHPDAMVPFFEAKFSRLEYTGRERLNMSYMRHTGEWVNIYSDLAIEECLVAITEDSLFEP